MSIRRVNYILYVSEKPAGKRGGGGFLGPALFLPFYNGKEGPKSLPIVHLRNGILQSTFISGIIKCKLQQIKVCYGYFIRRIFQLKIFLDPKNFNVSSFFVHR